MNKSEQKAYNWLLTQGYTSNDIAFQSSATPDFLTSTGASYEAKRVYGNTIWFYDNQVEKLKNTNTTILAMVDGSSEPAAQIPASTLKDNAVTHGMKIAVKPVDGAVRKVTFYLSREANAKLNRWVGEYAAAHNISAYGLPSKVVNAAIQAYIESEVEKMTPEEQERFRSNQK